MNPLRSRLAIAVAMSLALGLVSASWSPALAFNGPASGQAAGTGSGALGVGSNQDVSVGTSTASTNTKLLLQASSTNDTSNYVFKVIDSSQNPLFIIRNDGTIGVDTSNLSGGTLNVNGLVSSENGFTGSVSAANVTAGTFGNNYGGGTFSFPDAVCIGFSGCGDLLSVRAAGSWTGEGNTTASFGSATAGTDSVALQTRNSNGGDLLTVFGNGTVGINGFSYGGLTPMSTLDVNGSEAIGSYAGHNAAPSNGLIVSGDVGIGTTNPGMSLDIQKDQHGYTGVRVTNTDMTSGDYGTQAGYWISGTASAVSIGALKWVPQLLGGAGALYLTTESNYPLAFGLDSSPTPAMVINTNGNVGIGTTAPSNALEIGGNNQAIQVDYNGGPSYAGELRWAGLQLGNNGANRIVAGRSSPGGNLVFYTNNTNDAANYNVAPDGTLALMLDASGSAQFYQNVTVSGNLTVDGTFGGQALTGTLSAANVSAGTFGSNTGGGEYMFPGTVAILDGGAGNSGFYFEAGFNQTQILLNSSGADYGRIENDSANTWSLAYGTAGNAALGTPVLSWNGSGDVGIGTTNPLVPLVVSDDGAQGFEFIPNGSFGTYLQAYNRASSTYDNLDFNALSYGFRLSSASADSVTINSSGNVGIGTASPGAKLDVSGTANFGGGSFSNGRNGAVDIRDTNNAAPVAAGDGLALGNTAGYYWIQSYDGDQLVLNPLGNDVGIGTTNPSAELTVSPSGGDWNEGIDINPAPDNYDGVYLRQTAGSITGSWFVGKENNGNLGILRNGLTGMGTVSRVDAPLEISSSTGAAIFGGNVTVNSNAQINGDIIPSASSNTGGSNWILGSGVWGGTVSGDDSVTGLMYDGGTGSQLFTLSSVSGQASMEMDGSLFLGDGAPSYNPYSLTAASDGELAVNGNAEIGGSLNVQGSITSGGFTGTLSAGNVSAGTFGSNTGGGNYVFPSLLTLAGFNAGEGLDINWSGAGYANLYGGTNPNVYFEPTGSGDMQVNALANGGGNVAAFMVEAGGYPTSYQTELGAMSGAQGVLELGNNGENDIRCGNYTTGGYCNVYVNNTAQYSAASNGTLAMQFQANGNVSIPNTLDVSGSLTLTASNPNLYTGGGYLNIPYGLYVSGGTTYINGTLNARGGLNNDNGATLTISGGTSGYTDVTGELGIGTTAPDGPLEVNGHISVAGTGPTSASCGSVSGNDDAGTVTSNSPGVNYCLVYFGKAWASTPTCVVVPTAEPPQYLTGSTGVYAESATWVSAVGTTYFEIQQNANLNSESFYYVCVGH